jgi:hypothetical protein
MRAGFRLVSRFGQCYILLYDVRYQVYTLQQHTISNKAWQISCLQYSFQFSKCLFLTGNRIWKIICNHVVYKVSESLLLLLISLLFESNTFSLFLHFIIINKLYASESWEDDVAQLVKKYRNRRFVTVFTTACQWTPSWASPTQSTPSLRTYLRFSLILSSHVHPRPLSFRFSDWDVCILHVPHSSYMPRPSHPPSFDHPNIWRRIQIMKFFIMLFPSPCYFLPYTPNMIFSLALCSNMIVTITSMYSFHRHTGMLKLLTDMRCLCLIYYIFAQRD